MFRLFSFLSLLTIGGLLCACGLDLGDAPFFCNKDGDPECPTGYTCNSGNVCVREGTCPAGLPGCPTCGNGTCESEESCNTCEPDCGKCLDTCGNGNCDSGETCINCEQDCGECADTCGNGNCDSGENCTNCEQDCGKCTDTCGNGNCDSGETEINCPDDCSSTECQHGQTQCDGQETLRKCETGEWKSYTCESVCIANGYDYSTGCTYLSTTSKDDCVCGTAVGFGELCSEQSLCESGLICVRFDTGSLSFCTKYCTSDYDCSGGPSGSTAWCILSVNSQGACGFICDWITTFCPAWMQCDLLNELCMP